MDEDEVRGGGGVRTKLYFLSSRHVLGVQDSRIPRVFKDSSPSFVCDEGRRASPKGSNPSGSHARVLVPVYKMNTWKLEPRFYTRTRVFGHECTRARGRNRKPRSSRITTEQYAPSLFHPRWHEDTPPPSGHTCGQHKRNIHKQSSIS